MIEIKKATTADVDLIRQLADAIWWPTYAPIISEAQISYMLENIYSSNVIWQQIENDIQTYIILYVDNIPTGFAAYSTRPENTDVYKLHKLYCLVNTKGKGYGKLLLQAVENAVTDAGKNILELNVNRNNPAIAFYEKMGFTTAYTEDIDIGNGYYMNDYVMRKLL
ncbi:MAG: GNAT family N-acetyltransferase [Bacteroidetes bacterium]|nr:GNAT family N-acetyltransferase [Bacteroidota bacterium]